ncbi:MAG: hypothetical protein GEU98_04645 [Pseudonocardiaceae bacterium]|nr:hypothetical protein [Pseudonocardiaceae bacterium]
MTADSQSQPPSAHTGRLIHQMLEFGSAEELASTAGRFALDGVSAGEPVLCVATEDTIRTVRAAVGEHADRIEFYESPPRVAMPDQRVEEFRRYVHQHHKAHRVRALGEPLCDGPWELRRREWHRAEAAMNIVLNDQPLWLVCLYDARRVAPAEIEQARRTHPQLYSVEHGVIASEDYTDPAELGAVLDTTELGEPGQLLAERAAAAEDLADVRRLVGNLATQHGLPADRTEDFVFAVSEVTTNAIEHGDGPGQLRLWRADARLACDVISRGPGFDKPFPGYNPPTQSAVSGHGLWIARQCCDLFEIRNQTTGTTVRMHMALPPASGRA